MMRMKFRGIVLALYAVGVLILGGCAGSFVNPYVYAAPDFENVSESGIALFIRTNAYSIAQGYKPQKDH